MAVSVVCLTSHLTRYKRIAEAMAAGVQAYGDKAVVRNIFDPPAKADVAVSYGWKHHRILRRYPQFVYADLGYWQRDRYYRFAVNGWSPEVRAGLPGDRFSALGLEVKPWRDEGRQIIVAGSTQKACADHGLGYMEWERKACERLRDSGYQVVYRPKPTDRNAKPIPGFGYDERPISDALRAAHLWVTHHSNSALDALVAGVPVHCQTGAAAMFSVPLDAVELRDGRQEFLDSVGWLQWTLAEMRSGQAWAHLRTYLADL